jgi:hypothetical protein
MTKIAVKRDKGHEIRYQIQARPGITRLVAKFDESQLELLERCIGVLCNAEEKLSNDYKYITMVNSNRKLAAIAADI